MARLEIHYSWENQLHVGDFRLPCLIKPVVSIKFQSSRTICHLFPSIDQVFGLRNHLFGLRNHLFGQLVYNTRVDAWNVDPLKEGPHRSYVQDDLTHKKCIYLPKKH